MAAEATLLSEVPLFERLSEEERALLAAELDEVTFKPGEKVFNRGDPGGAIFIVSSGEVQIYVEDTTGEKIVFETAKRGDFFGELSLFDGEPRSANALAIAETRALRVDRNDLSLLFKTHPHAAIDVLAVMGRRLREADHMLRNRPVRSANQAIEEKQTPVQKVADAMAAFAGRFSFLVLHAVWFLIWIMINMGLTPIQPFDPYPFGLLTMVVSLEAIFLSCMVMISQNRQGEKDRIRADVEYEANIRAGLEVTQLHVKVDHFYDQLMARLATLEQRGGNGVPRP
jgi:CRP/FNR family cyclic AMP-dependent transcriptional regulator